VGVWQSRLKLFLVIEIKFQVGFASGISGESKGVTRQCIGAALFLLIKDLDARILIQARSILVCQLQIDQIDL